MSQTTKLSTMKPWGPVADKHGPYKGIGRLSRERVTAERHDIATVRASNGEYCVEQLIDLQTSKWGKEPSLEHSIQPAKSSASGKLHTSPNVPGVRLTPEEDIATKHQPRTQRKRTQKKRACCPVRRPVTRKAYTTKDTEEEHGAKRT